MRAARPPPTQGRSRPARTWQATKVSDRGPSVASARVSFLAYLVAVGLAKGEGRNGEGVGGKDDIVGFDQPVPRGEQRNVVHLTISSCATAYRVAQEAHHVVVEEIYREALYADRQRLLALYLLRRWLLQAWG